MNYAPPPPFPSDARITRLATWLTLTVVWFAAHVLALVAPAIAKRRLATYASWTQTLIIAKSIGRLRATHAMPRAGFARDRRLTLRIMGGAKLRHALQASNATKRARAIHALITYPEAWITQTMRRITRGFSKLCALPCPPSALGAVQGAPLPDVRALDSS